MHGKISYSFRGRGAVNGTHYCHLLGAAFRLFDVYHLYCGTPVLFLQYGINATYSINEHIFDELFEIILIYRFICFQILSIARYRTIEMRIYLLVLFKLLSCVNKPREFRGTSVKCPTRPHDLNFNFIVNQTDKM